MNTKTCGPMYLEGLALYTKGDPGLVRVFAAGFVNGQAEKVYIGACAAAMFRPSPELKRMVDEVVTETCKRYDLAMVDRGDEIWICRNENVRGVTSLDHMEVNSPEWHRWRGWLCGIPLSETDPEFHLRKGYGEPCDRVGSDG